MHILCSRHWNAGESSSATARLIKMQIFPVTSLLLLSTCCLKLISALHSLQADCLGFVCSARTNK